jgi:CHAD domain-containing protein
MTSVASNGDRAWLEAGREAVDRLLAEVGERAKAVRDQGDADAVHDMRTATRRVRTAIELYGSEAPKKDRRAAETELKRVARRLGEVRDLDILLTTVDGAEGDLSRLRDAWQDERSAGARRLNAALGRGRFRRALARAHKLVRARDGGAGANAAASRERIATRAPALIWTRYGRLLAHELDPAAADPAAIHRLRIDAKLLRYTLEAFADALEPGATLIAEVTALQDAGGEMHDAIVAADRAHSTFRRTDLSKAERSAIDDYATSQANRAESLRPAVARALRAVRSRAFRESLGRALAGMGSVAP